MKNHVIRIYGKVQGVFFRESAKEKANTLNVKGIIQNMIDGSVYAEAEGEDDKLEEFKKWCEKGPNGAIVDKVTVQEGEVKNYPDFKVTRSVS